MSVREYDWTAAGWLVNESIAERWHRDDASWLSSVFEGWVPGDVVRKRMFEDDVDRPSDDFPIGIVAWVIGESNVVGVLWSNNAQV